MFRRGGLATQADYPYEGINNFCRKDVGDQGFKGFLGGLWGGGGGWLLSWCVGGCYWLGGWVLLAGRWANKAPF